MRQLAAALLLATYIAAAQAPMPPHAGPPACIALRPPTPHPSPSDILQTQEKESADPTVIALPDPVANMGILRFQVRDYADCTDANVCYWADLDAQTQRARALLEDAVRATPINTKKALILDIDETSLSSYCEEVQEDFGYIPDRFEAWIVSKDASIPVAGTVALAKRAQALGVDVFFITGRPESQREATEQNLHTAGYTNWKHLSLRQTSDTGHPTADFKAAERAKIVSAGYTLLLNMGDQWSDLQGAPMALHSVKLPNPFYYLP